MGFFNQFGGSPVRGLLGSGIYRGLDMGGFDPSPVLNGLANNAMLPQPDQQGQSTLGRIIAALGAGMQGIAGAQSKPVQARPPSIHYTSPPSAGRSAFAKELGGDRPRWAFTNKYGRGA